MADQPAEEPATSEGAAQPPPYAPDTTLIVTSLTASGPPPSLTFATSPDDAPK